MSEIIVKTQADYDQIPEDFSGLVIIDIRLRKGW